MIVKATEIVYHKYREVFDKEKTAKAFGYWKPYNHVETFFRLAKSASQEDLKSGKVYSALVHSIGVSQNNRAERLLRRVCVCSMYNISADDFASEYLALCKEIESINLSCLNNPATEMLICLLLTLGMFSAALLLREKYEDKILSYGSDLQKYSVYFQNGSFTQAHNLLQTSHLFRCIKLLSPRTYASMENSILPIVNPEKADTSSPFARYLLGKSVFIIGPSDNNSPVNIPDKNRVVIRYAYMGKSKLGGYYQDVSTDVSYYNGMHATTVASMDQTEFLSDISFAVLKYKLPVCFWENLGGMLYVRYANRVPYAMQHGVSPNMLQIVLADLLPLGKLNLTVLDNNLYLNRHYTEGYASNQVQKKMDDYAFANQFAKHDVFCNFKFTKALFMQGFFSADSRLTGILQMSCEQFAEAMESEYGHQRSL